MLLDQLYSCLLLDLLPSSLSIVPDKDCSADQDELINLRFRGQYC